MRPKGRDSEEQRNLDAEYEEDSRDPIQEEIDAEGTALLQEFGKDVPARNETTFSKAILRSFVAAHCTLSEKKRAYALAMWVLRNKGDKS